MLSILCKLLVCASVCASESSSFFKLKFSRSTKFFLSLPTLSPYKIRIFPKRAGIQDLLMMGDAVSNNSE